MRHATTAAIAGALTLYATASMAADLAPVPPPPPPCIPPGAPSIAGVPACAVEFSGFYLRGFIGMSNQQVKNISHPAFATAPQFTFLDKGGFDSAPFYGVGVGYQWNDWLRTDITAEYRGSADFHALDRFNNGGVYNTNQYTASKSEWVALFNAYVDMGTWWGITPFVGAGVGVAWNTIDHFRDVNVIAGGGGWADSNTTTNLAWALYAGAAYHVTPNLILELSYRYLDLGKAQSGTLQNLDPTFVSGNPKAPVTFNNITSNDVMIGVRYMLQPEAAYAPTLGPAFMPAPSYVPPEPVTAPQPNSVYAPPAPGYESYPTLHQRG